MFWHTSQLIGTQQWTIISFSKAMKRQHILHDIEWNVVSWKKGKSFYQKIHQIVDVVQYSLNSSLFNLISFLAILYESTWNFTIQNFMKWMNGKIAINSNEFYLNYVELLHFFQNQEQFWVFFEIDFLGLVMIVQISFFVHYFLQMFVHIFFAMILFKMPIKFN